MIDGKLVPAQHVLETAIKDQQQKPLPPSLCFCLMILSLKLVDRDLALNAFFYTELRLNSIYSTL